jgi:DNA-binding CsgD family transcriptional regulator
VNDAAAPRPIRLALDLSAHELADRLAALLADVEGLSVVSSIDEADATIVTPARQRPHDTELSLTPREREVLALLAEGVSNKLIAQRLGISVHTAKFHVRSVIDKLDAVGRTDAVAHAARLGIVHL